MDCDIPHWLGRRTKHPLQGCGNISLADAFESPKMTISASGELELELGPLQYHSISASGGL